MMVLNLGDEAIRLLGEEAGEYHEMMFQRGSHSSMREAPAVSEPVWLAFSGILAMDNTFSSAAKWDCKSDSCTKTALA